MLTSRQQAATWFGEMSGLRSTLARTAGIGLDEPRGSPGSPAVPAGAAALEQRGTGLRGAGDGSAELRRSREGPRTGSGLEVQNGHVGVGQHLTTSLYLHSVLLFVSNQTLNALCASLWWLLKVLVFNSAVSVHLMVS